MANLLILMIYSFRQELICWSVGDLVHKCHYILYQTITVQSEMVSVEDTSSYSFKKRQTFKYMSVPNDVDCDVFLEQ